MCVLANESLENIGGESVVSGNVGGESVVSGNESRPTATYRVCFYNQLSMKSNEFPDSFEKKNKRLE